MLSDIDDHTPTIGKKNLFFSSRRFFFILGTTSAHIQ
jgi:hypothetical protein